MWLASATIDGMCARFTLRSPADLLAERFGLLQVPVLTARYNIAPSQMIPVIGAKASGARGLAMFKWGFIPHWAQDDKGMKPVNARAERVATTPMFSESFRRRRCIVPADGFYEWRTVNKKKMPVHFRLKDGSPFGFAGVWDVWNGPSGKLFSVAIVMTTPNELTRTVHDRMPVILARDDESTWLDVRAATWTDYRTRRAGSVETDSARTSLRRSPPAPRIIFR